MADIKKFTGFIAPDGSTHESLKKATDHTRDLKIREALAAAFNENTITEADTCVMEDGQGAFVYCNDMAGWLHANKDKIEACFNQDVLMRKKRESKPRAPKADTLAATLAAGLASGSVKFVGKPAAPAPVAAPAAPAKVGAPAHAGILELDE